jgi:DNA helicase-4
MGLIDELVSLLFPPKQYGERAVTVLGEEVKSGGEKAIADFLTLRRIRYEYEPLVEAGVWIFSQKVSRPDFYLPDYDLYVEYWGMVDVADADDREKYVRSMKWKMRQYHELGVRFISIYPRDLRYLDWIFRKKFKEATGCNLPP